MKPRRFGSRLVRFFARCASWLYPARFRREHGAAFADVADHLFQKAAARKPGLVAVLDASGVIVTDTLATSPAMWMEAITEGERSLTVWQGARRRVGRLVHGAGQDFQLAVRTARRRPALSLLVVATLGLGIGASAAAFDALDRAILHPLPFARSEELVLLVMQEARQKYTTSVPPAALAQWRARSTTLTRVEVFRRLSAVRATASGADVLTAVGISGGLPDMLQVRPVIGRMLALADAQPASAATVMLTEQFWRREFGGDPSVVGRQMTLGGKPAEIIGVWPAGARLDFLDTPDVVRVLPAGAEYNQGSWAQVLARRRPERSAREVEAELATLTPPTRNATSVYAPVAIAPADLLLGPQFVTGVWLVFAGGVLLLGAAITNAGHLLLERATERGHELGIRLALGGSRSRIVRLFLAEGVTFAAGGLAAGALIAAGLEGVIGRYEPRLFLEVAGAGLGGRAFGFVAGVAVLATLACTLAPLLRTGRRNLALTLNRAETRVTAIRSRAMNTLVGTQAGLAVVLLFGAAVMTHSLAKLLAVDPGIEISQLAELSVSLPATHYPSAAARELYVARAFEALQGLAGVTGVVTSGMPMLQASLVNGVPRLEGEPDVVVAPDATTAGGDVPSRYFRVMGLRLREGRTFADDEKDVAVVSERFAARRSGSVVGKMLYLPRATSPIRIVGVVNDVRYMGLANDAIDQPAVYEPAKATSTGNFFRFIVRTTGPPDDVIAGARQRLAEIDPAVPLLAPQTGPDVMRRQTAQHRFVAVLLAGLAGLGFVLAMSGVYGAVALSVMRRSREVAVRMALGASPDRIIRRFVVSGLKPVAAGAVAGGVGVWFAMPYVKALLFRVSAHDPISGAAGLGLVLATGALAAFVPARRISRIDAATTLRDA